MPRIILVMDKLTDVGGLECWAGELLAWLSHKGYELHVIASRFSGTARDLPITCHHLPEHHDRLERAMILEKMVKALQPGVVHDLGVGWSYHLLQPQAGSKVVNFHQALASLPRWQRWVRKIRPAHRRHYAQLLTLEQQQYCRPTWAGKIVAVSNMVKQTLKACYGLDEDRFSLVYNGIDSRRFLSHNRDETRRQVYEKLNLPADTVLFLMAGHNYRLKGVDTVLKALTLMPATTSPFHIVVIGQGQSDTYKLKAGQMGLAGSISFTGFVENPVPWFQAADVCLHPTFYDACSLTVLEAFAASLPVITTAANGASELMENDRHGYIMQNPADAAELARMICSLLDRDRRRTMAAEAGLLGTRVDREQNFRALEEIYSSIIQQIMPGRTGRTNPV